MKFLAKKKQIILQLKSVNKFKVIFALSRNAALILSIFPSQFLCCTSFPPLLFIATFSIYIIL